MLSSLDDTWKEFTLFKILSLFRTKDPKTRISIECQLMLSYSQKGNRFLRKLFQRRIYYKYGCEISHLANIDPSVTFRHPIAIVIGSNVVLEKNVTIYQGVTLGSNVLSSNEMPTVKEGAIICAGAKVIGGVTIGKNSIVGANTTVTKSIPDNATVVGTNILLNQK